MRNHGLVVHLNGEGGVLLAEVFERELPFAQPLFLCRPFVLVELRLRLLAQALREEPESPQAGARRAEIARRVKELQGN
mgnify:CR=1 FL=1